MNGRHKVHPRVSHLTTVRSRHRRALVLGALVPLLCFLLVTIGTSTPAGAASTLESTVLYANGYMYVDNNTTDEQFSSILLMQTDGNLVLYKIDQAGNWIYTWTTWTYGNPGAFAQLQGDGNLVVYNSSGGVLWASNTWTPGSTYVLSGDNNFSIFTPNSTLLWSTGTSVIPPSGYYRGQAPWGPPNIQWSLTNYQSYFSLETDPRQKAD